MSLQGILVVDVLGALFVLWIVNLVRTGGLHAGYAVLWLVASGSVILLVSIPPLLGLVTLAVGALFPASALSLLGFVFVFAVLILFSVRLSRHSERQARLAETIGLLEMERREASRVAESRDARPSRPEGAPEVDGE
ncbi:MAG: DUF2304 domain-containing protein [Longimicrobiales bacterium]